MNGFRTKLGARLVGIGAVFLVAAFATRAHAGGAPPVVTSPSLHADGEVGTPFSESFTATDVDGTAVWTNTAGTLPPGLTLAADGTYSGTPTTAGNYNFTVTVVDSDNTPANLPRGHHIAEAGVTTWTSNVIDGWSYAANGGLGDSLVNAGILSHITADDQSGKANKSVTVVKKNDTIAGKKWYSVHFTAMPPTDILTIESIGLVIDYEAGQSDRSGDLMIKVSKDRSVTTWHSGSTTAEDSSSGWIPWHFGKKQTGACNLMYDMTSALQGATVAETIANLNNCEVLLLNKSTSEEKLAPDYIRLHMDYVPAEPFIITVRTDNAGTSAANQFTIPLKPFEDYDFTVSFDGQLISHNTDSDLTLTFPSGPGTYDVEVIGSFPAIYFNNAGDKEKLLEIKAWGTTQWTSMASAFYNCSNMQLTATDTPDLTNVTDISRMFMTCFGMTSVDVTGWDVSNVTDMAHLFQGSKYIITITGLQTWDMSNVSSMKGMFRYNLSLQSINVTGWQLSAGPSLEQLFYRCYSLTEIIGYETWDVSTVTSLRLTFEKVAKTSLDFSSWNTTGALTNISRMLSDAAATEIEGLDNLNVTNVISAYEMLSTTTLHSVQKHFRSHESLIPRACRFFSPRLRWDLAERSRLFCQ